MKKVLINLAIFMVLLGVVLIVPNYYWPETINFILSMLGAGALGFGLGKLADYIQKRFGWE